MASTAPVPKVIANKLHEALLLHQQGHLLRAERLYEEILRSEPDHFDALNLLGVIAAASKDFARALDLVDRAIRLNPGSHAAHNNRGAALLDSGQWEAAVISFDRAIALNRESADAHFNRSKALRELGRAEDALASCDRAVLLNPRRADAHLNRGIILNELGRSVEALASFDTAVRLDGDLAVAHWHRANVLCKQRRWGAALAGFDRAIELYADNAEFHSNRAVALCEMRRLDESLDGCDRAIALKGDYVEAHCNRGCVLLAKRRVDEALSSFERALSISPDLASSHVNYALALLLAGDYERGWVENEWRWRDSSSAVSRERRHFRQPQWLGTVPLGGKTILLHCEQGFGDSIQFCRFAPLVAEMGARVVLEAPRALAPLLKSLGGVAQVVVQGDPLPDFDIYCPLLSLPLAFKTTVCTIPARIPYLAVTEDRRQLWQTRLGVWCRPRIGLVWSGGFRPAQPEWWSANERRNVDFAMFEALKGLSANFYSLQKGEPAESRFAQVMAGGWQGPQIENLVGLVNDFADTAAFVEQLDLVISVDTATAHLAGALGKPVWILNRYDACWRWLLDRDDSPWYPTARLYRQEQPGDWDSVMSKVARDLAQWLSGHHGTRGSRRPVTD